MHGIYGAGLNVLLFFDTKTVNDPRRAFWSADAHTGGMHVVSRRRIERKFAVAWLNHYRLPYPD
jgi:hypothetical protein